MSDVVSKRQVGEEYLERLRRVNRRAPSDLLFDQASSLIKHRIAIGQLVDDRSLPMCSISDNRILTPGLHLSRQLFNQTFSALTAGNTWLIQTIVLEQVSQLLARLLFYAKAYFEICTLAKDLCDL